MTRGLIGDLPRPPARDHDPGIGVRQQILHHQPPEKAVAAVNDRSERPAGEIGHAAILTRHRGQGNSRAAAEESMVSEIVSDLIHHALRSSFCIGG
jgi:hypothetical protein